MLREMFFGGFKERDGALMFINLLFWAMTFILTVFVYSVIDEHNGESATAKAKVTDIVFVPEHVQLVGKVVMFFEDEWVVKLSNGVSCSSSIDYFKVDDSIVVNYTVGGLSNAKYCDTIKKIELKD